MRKWLMYMLAMIKAEAFPCAAQEVRRQNVCAYHVLQHERLKSIPRHLLMAISKIESGRLNPHSQQVEAWPWTINVQGHGQFFASKNEAVRAVKNLLNQGIKSIDVGCMQVNLHHHKDAFASIEEAFDPKINIDYAAKFLSNLREAHGSWSKAVAHYHSATPAYHIPYRQKVLDVWRKENRSSSLEVESIPYRGAMWAKDRSARPGLHADVHYLRQLRQRDPQWRRYETRIAMADLRAKVLKTSRASVEKGTTLLSVTPQRRLRSAIVKGDRIKLAEVALSALPYQRRGAFFPKVYTKKPVVIAHQGN